jgi:hypothetical protein
MYSDFKVFKRDQEMLISEMEDQLHTFDFYALVGTGPTVPQY